MRPGYSWHSSSTSAGCSTAAVPTTTRSTPASSSSARRVGRAHAAADLDPAGDAADDRGDLVEVRAVAGAGGVEVDHVDPLRAGGLELARDAHRVVVVDGLGGEVALEQAHAVAAAQVDGGKRSIDGRASERALGRRHARALDPHRVAQRPGDALERRLDHVVAVAPDSDRMCSVIPAPNANARQNSSASCGSKVPIHSDDRVDLVHEERAARQVERDLHQRLVERDERRREPAHAGLVAERLLERGAEHDADVLDRVVGVDLEVARRLDRAGRTRRACPSCSSMWSKNGMPVDADALAAAVDVERRASIVGLLGGAVLAAIVARAAHQTATSWSDVAERGEERVVLLGRADGDTQAVLEAGPAREVAHEHPVVDQLLPSARGRRRRAGTAGSWRPTGTR